MKSHEHHTRPPPVDTPTPFSTPAIRSLLEMLGAGTAEPTVAGLHRAVCERVREMRDEGKPPETVLAALKRLAADAASEAPAIPKDRTPDRPSDGVALISQVAQWCIAEYFRRD